MTTSWNNMRLVEQYLLQQLDPADEALLQARLLLEPDLAALFQDQKQVQELVKQYGRRKLISEIAEAQRILFTERRYAGFRGRIARIFSKG